MKKLLTGITVLFLYGTTSAQVSFGTPKHTDEETLKAGSRKTVVNLENIVGLDSVNRGRKLTHTYLVNQISDSIKAIIADFKQKRLFILSDNMLKQKDKIIDTLVNVRDSLINRQKDLRELVKYWKRYDRFEEAGQKVNFFPAYYSKQAICFFEDDVTHLKLFQNNLINYNPKSKKMTLFTEAVNDYLGPFRVGIGFQVESESKVDSLSTIDSTKSLEKKMDLVSAIQNGGGDISLNIKYPIIKSGNRASGLQYKLYFYANTGFSLPVLNKASADFLFNYDGGIEGALYIKGFNNKLTFYTQLTASYYNGNKNFQKVITDADKNDPTSFVMFQTSFGIDFLDSYRIRVDLYNGNDFVKNNFPASVTFVVRPGK